MSLQPGLSTIKRPPFRLRHADTKGAVAVALLEARFGTSVISPEWSQDLSAAGEGFEPGLTDPESVSIPSSLFTTVQKTALSSQVARAGVSGCSPMFAPVTVRSLSKMLVMLCFLSDLGS